MAICVLDGHGFSLSLVPGLDEATVIPSGDLDAATADLVEREVDRLLAVGIRHLTLDLSGVTFMDSRGLRLLLVLRNDARRDGHALQLVPGTASVQRLFALTATTALFDWV
jgi:anti-sigma B factor antagonist